MVLEFAAALAIASALVPCSCYSLLLLCCYRAPSTDDQNHNYRNNSRNEPQSQLHREIIKTPSYNSVGEAERSKLSHIENFEDIKNNQKSNTLETRERQRDELPVDQNYNHTSSVPKTEDEIQSYTVIDKIPLDDREDEAIGLRAPNIEDIEGINDNQRSKKKKGRKRNKQELQCDPDERLVLELIPVYKLLRSETQIQMVEQIKSLPAKERRKLESSKGYEAIKREFNISDNGKVYGGGTGRERTSLVLEPSENSEYLLATTNINGFIRVSGYLKPYKIPKVPTPLHFTSIGNQPEQISDISIPNNLLSHIETFDHEERYLEYSSISFIAYRKIDQLLKCLDGKCPPKSPKVTIATTMFNTIDLLATPGLPFLRTKEMKAECLGEILLSLRITQKKALEQSEKRITLPPVCFAESVIEGDMEPKGEWVYPSVVNLLERRFSYSIYKSILTDESKTELPFKFIEDWDRSKLLENNQMICEFEIIDPHPNLPKRLIYYGFRILQKWVFGAEIDDIDNSPDKLSINQREIRAVWPCVEQYFINTPILLPSGQLIKKTTGAALGSEFTLIITSITCLFIGLYCMQLQNVDIDSNGDRIPIFTHGTSISMSVPKSFSIIQLVKDIDEQFHMKVDLSSVRVSEE